MHVANSIPNTDTFDMMRRVALSLPRLVATASNRTPAVHLSPLATSVAPQQPLYSKRQAFLSTASARPFRILGVQQIAIGNETREPLQKLWQDVFGIPAQERHRLEGENVEEDILRLGKGPFAVEIDLMCPIDPNSSPKVHKPPLNHIGLWVDDIHKAVEWMEANGVRFTPGGIRPGAAGHDVTFIHPKGNDKSPIGGNGVLIELVQAPPEVIEAMK